MELDREELEELEELDAVLPAEALLASCAKRFGLSKATSSGFMTLRLGLRLRIWCFV